MLLKITPYGNPLLRKQAKHIAEITPELKNLITAMSDTLRAAKGVGLAAPQVGESAALFIMDWAPILENETGPIKAYINPEIIALIGSREIMQEGCLSLPQIWEDVERAATLRVSYQNERGEKVEEVLSGLAARVFQHEFDHLRGVLLIDHLSARRRKVLQPNLQAIMDGKVKPYDGSHPVENETEAERGIKV